ncbi:MAG TPA: hypothetical protein VLW46_00710 [Candidatus Bathyarchaeia archaeon]|nr:hypothetical protein [Candidatus Bathyarchaeia archaeon]
MSAFSVMGFVKGSWPVVFDYLLERDSLIIVVIAPEGATPVVFRLKGKRGHWQSKVMIPDTLGNKALVAEYAVRAFDDNVGQLGPSHFHIHGIAAGPKAVGSIGIDRVTFLPGKIRPSQGEKAHYTFHSISDFKHAEVDFVRIALGRDGQIVAARVGSKSYGAITKNEQKDGDWNGKIQIDSNSLKAHSAEVQQWLTAPTGQHLIQVRAWWGADDGDWATALSDEFVAVEQ